MKITFVGTSHGVPEPGRKCSCIMVEAGGRIYFVDMGTSAVDALRRRGKDMESVRGIFITHMHGDHTDGLIEYVDLITWYFKSCDPVIVLPDPTAGKIISDWLKVTLNGNTKDVRYRQTCEGTVYEDEVLRVTAVPTQHCKGSFAYILEAEGRAVLCTGDLRNPGIDFPYTGKPLDLLICESAHFPATDYLPVLEKMTVRRLCVTHYSPRFMKSVLELKETLDGKAFPMLLATDDLEIDV